MPVKVVGSLIKSVSNPSRILQSVTYYVKLDPAAVDIFFQKKPAMQIVRENFLLCSKTQNKKVGQ